MREVRRGYLIGFFAGVVLLVGVVLLASLNVNDPTPVERQMSDVRGTNSESGRSSGGQIVRKEGPAGEVGSAAESAPDPFRGAKEKARKWIQQIPSLGRMGTVYEKRWLRFIAMKLASYREDIIYWQNHPPQTMKMVTIEAYTIARERMMIIAMEYVKEGIYITSRDDMVDMKMPDGCDHFCWADTPSGAVEGEDSVDAYVIVRDSDDDRYSSLRAAAREARKVWADTLEAQFNNRSYGERKLLIEKHLAALKGIRGLPAKGRAGISQKELRTMEALLAKDLIAKPPLAVTLDLQSYLVHYN